MASQVPPTTDERDNLLKYVAQQRDTFRYVAHGLSDEQARLRPTVGELSIGGLIKHVATMERGWIAVVKGEPEVSDENEFTMLPEETLAGLLAELEKVGEETKAVVLRLPMDHPVPIDKSVPWNPQDVDAWSLRWVLGHLIEELARHAGHADIVREAIDGKTMYELQAMADGWHEQYLAMIANWGKKD